MATATAPAISPKLHDVFTAAGIKYENFEHPAVLTVEEQKEHVKVPAPHTKNLFLKDKSGKFWLVSALDDTATQFKTMETALGTKGLRFAKDEDLQQRLGVVTGAVSIYAMINDEERLVTPVLDAKLFEHEKVAFHPLRNTATTLISSQDLLKFFTHLKREFKTLNT